MTTAPRDGLVVTHPALDRPVHVSAGAAVLVEGDLAEAVVATLLGRDASGTAHVDGHRLRGGPARRVRRGLAVVSGAPVAPDVSVHDHLAAVVGARGARRVLADAPLLHGRGDDPAGVLSGGERRVLAWLRARALEPRAVLLDGAGEGLDADTLGWAGGLVAAWTTEGVAVLVRPGRTEERAWAAPGGGHTSPLN